MEIISGANNWELVIQRKNNEIVILSAKTCDVKAALPSELFGLPVTELAHHALASGRAMPEGETVRITCGPASGEYNNSELEELFLPETLKRAGDYAFYKCGKLKKLHLSDSLIHWGGGALMNCRNLDTFFLQCSGREGEVLSYLADELIRELDVSLIWENGESARVIFPEYFEVYEENVPHHQFDFHIRGAGYAYHHCFYQKKFNLRDYDELWKGYLGMEYDPDCAARVAWWRLRYPVELAEKAATAYWEYLAVRQEETARWRIRAGDAAGLRFLLTGMDWEKQLLERLCGEAREQGATEILAILLEEQHRRYPTGFGKTFDL